MFVRTTLVILCSTVLAGCPGGGAQPGRDLAAERRQELEDTVDEILAKKDLRGLRDYARMLPDGARIADVAPALEEAIGGLEQAYLEQASGASPAAKAAVQGLFAYVRGGGTTLLVNVEPALKDELNDFGVPLSDAFRDDQQRKRADQLRLGLEGYVEQHFKGMLRVRLGKRATGGKEPELSCYVVCHPAGDDSTLQWTTSEITPNGVKQTTGSGTVGAKLIDVEFSLTLDVPGNAEPYQLMLQEGPRARGRFDTVTGFYAAQLDAAYPAAAQDVVRLLGFVNPDDALAGPGRFETAVREFATQKARARLQGEARHRAGGR